ncbi:hypothetical protein HPP92_020423 [Vanilla planifolia]|uniref:Uncharacterized protein n=1 Tax=Vanilla planifolia TaxID=51239 RepID=A0A835Q778_VANPL|nr:hypothetical protein HPP92_020423 [Vanilla planifolia]
MPNSGVKLDGCSFLNGEVGENEQSAGRAAYSVSHKIDSLCYKPPQLEDICVSSCSSTFHWNTTMQPTSYLELFSSPITYSTSSSAIFSSSNWPSVESILRSAARSFTNTPSIIRRRDAHKLLPPNAMHTNENRTQGSCTPEDGKVKDDQEGSALSNIFSNPCTINGDVFEQEKDFSFSPPYRLRSSKRKLTSKQLEKRLDFPLKEADFGGNTNHSTLEVNLSSCSPTNIHLLSLHGKKLKANPTGCEESNFSSTTKLGVT